MYPGQHIDLLILLIQQVLQVPHFGLERPHSFLQRLGVSSGECSAAEFVAGLAFEADVGALRTARSDSVAADLFASASVTGLGNAALGPAAHLDHFHGENAGHFGEVGRHQGWTGGWAMDSTSRC